MNLRFQLALVCSTFLAIPWSGCEFLRANEQALLKLQRQALEVSGSSIAAGLYNKVDLLYPDPDRARAPISTDSLVASRVGAAPVLDGYFDEWEGIHQHHFGSGPRTLDVSASVFRDRLFLGIRVGDISKTFDNTGLGSDPSGDRLILTTWINGKRQRYVLATSAPGEVRARVLGRQLPDANADSIRGVWADVATGYQLELTLPLRTATSRLGIQYLDVDEGGVSTRGNVASLDTQAPPWLVFPPPGLDRWLEDYETSSVTLELLDRWGWPLERSSSATEVIDDDSFWLTSWLYRYVLEEPQTQPTPVTDGSGRIRDPAIDSAINGVPMHSLINVDGELRSRFVTPINSDNGLIGLLVIEQPRERYLSMTSSAFEGLLLSGGAALALAMLALLAYAVFLSIRIERLTHATSCASRDDRHTTPLPITRLNDEIDQLAISFGRQLEEQRQLQDYLRALPRSLAHEIRTPIAIIRATLETLSDTTLSAAQRTSLLERGNEGLSRLVRMLDAMNEANRLEASINQEALVATDLSALLGELCAAYQSTFPSWRFDIDNPFDAALVEAAPDLLVQAMDKLVANATSFTHAGDTITLRLERRGLWWRLSVSNPGPALPDNIEPLFSPMVSQRKKSGGDTTNMGLGLYIVALIARHHGGEPWAQNRATADGAEVGFTIRAQ